MANSQADPQKLDGVYISYTDAGIIYPSPASPTAPHGHYDSTPEVVAPSALEPYHSTFHATTIVNNSWSRPPSQEKDNDEQRRILGLSVKAFWTLVVLLTTILAGGIGGGLGALAAQRNREASTTTVKADPTPTQPEEAGVSPAPVDGGCPAINGTVYKPKGADGKGILVDIAAQEQTFMRLCATDFATGALGGNPEIHDIVKLYLPSLEECIAACAMYNARYQFKQDKGVEVAGGMCHSVTIVKKGEYCPIHAPGIDGTGGLLTTWMAAGGYCYLKNGTAKNFIKEGENPNDTSSAVILTY